MRLIDQIFRLSEAGAPEALVQALDLLPAPAAAWLTDRAGLAETVDGDDPPFDEAHYRAQLGTRAPRHPRLHYLFQGSAAGLKPNSRFDPAGYHRRYPGVRQAGYEPFAHYRRFGRTEGRWPAPGRREAVPPPAPPLEALLALPPRGAEQGAAVDVAIPVYGNRDDTLRAIGCVLAAPVREPFRLVVIDDASPDVELARELDALGQAGAVHLLRNPRNLGFVGSVNRGLAAAGTAGRDIVLLNSDTAVFGDWLDRLRATMRSAPRVGTVTPLSNAATILSYPFWLGESDVALGLDFAELDELARSIAAPPLPVPTGIGFCMLIGAGCLRETGPFDAETFGRGYGEENDFCLRASAGGWLHLASGNVFVWHRGGGSFGTEKQGRVDAAQIALARLHPRYGKLVGDHIGADPLARLRADLDCGRLRRDPRRKVVGLAAGSGSASDTLRLGLVPDLGPHAAAWRLTAPEFGPVPNLPRLVAASAPEALADRLQRAGVAAVDPAGLAGWPARLLRRAAAVAGIPVVTR